MALALVAGAGAQSFPSASAKLLWEAGHPVPATLAGGADPAPSAARVAAAERRLRAVAGGKGRNAALASFALGEALLRSCGATQGADFARCAKSAAADLAQAAEYPAFRDAATLRLVEWNARANDAGAALAAANQYALDPKGPFYTAIARQAGPAAVAQQDWAAALRWSGAMPEGPAALWTRAQAEAGLGNAREAALAERTLIYRYPNAAQAEQAAPLWRQALDAMPELAPSWRLQAEQATAWLQAGRAATAAREREAAAAAAPEGERARLEADAARAWMAARSAGDFTRLLTDLLRGPERAQALEMEVEWARKQKLTGAGPSLASPSDPLGATGDLATPLGALEAEFPASAWRARALHEAGDQGLVDLDVQAVDRYFSALCRDFPGSAYAPNACWQAAWAAYRQGAAATPERLDAYLRRFPRGGNAVDALYWRGRWDAAHGETAAGRALWRRAAREYPGTYFGEQAADELGLKSRGSGPALRASAMPAAAAAEVRRAAWLREGGLLDAAAAILAAELRKLPSGHASLALARTLDTLDGERRDYHGGLLAMIRAVPDYLRREPAELEAADWRRLYPRPFAADVDAVAEHDGLDRDLVWGLMRQESGFDAGSVSAARARGLMQLELDTARGRFGQLPRAWRAIAGRGRLGNDDLLNPGLNLALGAAELKGLLGAFDDTAYALAGYNAGPGRMAQWRQGLGGLKTNEFIESIPFAQTREYVQAVLRNREHYRWIYRH